MQIYLMQFIYKLEEIMAVGKNVLFQENNVLFVQERTTDVNALHNLTESRNKTVRLSKVEIYTHEDQICCPKTTTRKHI